MPYHKISASLHLVASPAQEGEVELYRVPAASTLRNIALNIHFPVGTLGDLELALRHGIFQLLPASGKYTGDGTSISDRSDGRWWSGESVRLHFKNANLTENREAYILLEAELE